MHAHAHAHVYYSPVVDQFSHLDASFPGQQTIKGNTVQRMSKNPPTLDVMGS